MLRSLSSLLLLLFLTAPATLCAAEFRGKVTWVYDGDTIKVEKIGKVRLIGIDSPEREASYRDRYYRNKHSIPAATLRKIAQQAKEFNLNKAKGERVRLATDHEERDKHGRLLAYVYLPGGKMLNRLLLKEGLAAVFRRYDFRYKKEFIKLEQRAQKKKRGLWR